ncbi:ATP-binding protein [Calothrix sp. FACHB-156]|nr:ATP-binding protein [Calothrix sp. FACHB-156]
MSHNPNPFFVSKSVPPEKFVGRTSEIAAAFDQIYNRSHLAIWGAPGMGKTSFLQKLASPAAWEEHGLDPSEAVIVLLNCENLSPFTPSGFWREVLSLLKEQLDSEPKLQAEIDTLLTKGQTSKDSLRQILKKIGQQKKFLLLLIDDYDAALRENEEYTTADMEKFLSECRSLAVHSQERQYLSMIVTSLQRLNELGPKLNPNASPWYNHYLFQSLKPLTNKELTQLLNAIRTQELREAIQEIAGGHPSLLQIAGFLLYRELQTEKKPEVEAFIRDFESTTTHIFQNIWARCSDVEQTLLILMALSGLNGRLHRKKQFDLSGIDLIFTQRERELNKLEEKCVVVRTTIEEKSIYLFTSSIMERWVIQEIWNTDDAWLKNRERVFLNLMSHQQVKKFKTAISWLWQHKNDVPPILEWFSKVLALFP